MIKPMVARLVRDSFDRKDWIFEIKWDGFRAIAETDRTDGLKLHSRNQNDFKKRFPPIAEAPAKLKEAAIRARYDCLVRAYRLFPLPNNPSTPSSCPPIALSDL